MKYIQFINYILLVAWCITCSIKRQSNLYSIEHYKESKTKTNQHFESILQTNSFKLCSSKTDSIKKFNYLYADTITFFIHE